MGNSDNSPNDGKLSLDTSAPLWSAILTDISHGLPIAEFVKPADLETAEVDAFTGLKPGPFTRKTVEELFVPGTVPTQKETSRIARKIDEASGLRWQEACAGPMVTRGFFDLSEVEASHENWQKANAAWGARAAHGAGVRGGPESTRTSYFYNNSFAPFGRTWGAPFAPTGMCPIVAPPVPICDPFFSVCPPPPVEATFPVPNLQCQTLEAASATLTTAGFAVGNVRQSSPGRDPVVWATRPDAGAFLPLGSSVDLTFRARSKVPGCG
jgi:Membrane carboxypeptidase/penicillin-binding protein